MEVWFAGNILPSWTTVPQSAAPSPIVSGDSSLTGDMDNCYESFRLHCIAIHGLHTDDTESWLHFDLENLMLRLLKT
jgi:hypothetical protein